MYDPRHALWTYPPAKCFNHNRKYTSAALVGAKRHDVGVICPSPGRAFTREENFVIVAVVFVVVGWISEREELKCSWNI